MMYINVLDTVWNKERKVFFIPSTKLVYSTIVIVSKDREIRFQHARTYAAYNVYRMDINPFLEGWMLSVINEHHPRFIEVCSILEKRKG